MERGSEGQISKVLVDGQDVVSEGKPCVKGLTVHEVVKTNRVTVPMICRDKGGTLERVSWDEAFDFIAGNLGILEQSAGDRIRDKVYFVGSGETNNESNYLLSKLCRGHFKSNNIDSCARLCHSATANAFKRMFGIAAIPEFTMNDVAEGDFFLFIGTDPM